MVPSKLSYQYILVDFFSLIFLVLGLFVEYASLGFQKCFIVTLLLCLHFNPASSHLNVCSPLSDTVRAFETPYYRVSELPSAFILIIFKFLLLIVNKFLLDLEAVFDTLSFGTSSFLFLPNYFLNT